MAAKGKDSKATKDSWIAFRAEDALSEAIRKQAHASRVSVAQYCRDGMALLLGMPKDAPKFPGLKEG